MQKRKKLLLTDLIQSHKHLSYEELYRYICQKIDEGSLLPITTSGVNGKKPALYQKYWQVSEVPDYNEIQQELQYVLHPSLDISYYEKHPQNYQEDRDYILKLNNYFTSKKGLLTRQETVNERSFEIFGREKFISRQGGRKLLSRLGIQEEKLCFYETSEPMSYYTCHKNTPQNFVIIENKDTFYSMRKHLIEKDTTIMGLDVGTLIYGSGKGIHKTFEDYANGVEPYFKAKGNQVYYFGDLDYEGIEIYESFAKNYQEKYGITIKLWTDAYVNMLKKAEQWLREDLPDTKEGQRPQAAEMFLNNFPKEVQAQILDLLNLRKYIPQEILNEHDYGT